MINMKEVVKLAKKIANDDSHGYSQIHRNGNPDFDCSSFIGYCLHENGAKNANVNSTTRTLKKQLLDDGFVIINKGPWKSGDIHLKEGHHVVMSINAKQIVHASIDENGTIKGLKPGDQTGKEICIRDYYEKGWDYHFRYNDSCKLQEKTEQKKNTLKIKVNGLRIRKNAGLGYDIIGKLKKGDIVELVSTEKKQVGSNTWMHIKKGWICVNYGGVTYAE